MAEIEKKTVQVPVTVTREETQIVLTLSEDEAKVISVLAGLVSGGGELRKVTSELYQKLERLGIVATYSDICRVMEVDSRMVEIKSGAKLSDITGKSDW